MMAAPSSPVPGLRRRQAPAWEDVASVESFSETSNRDVDAEANLEDGETKFHVSRFCWELMYNLIPTIALPIILYRHGRIGARNRMFWGFQWFCLIQHLDFVVFAAANVMFWYRGEDGDDVTAVELVLANCFYTLRALTIGAKYGFYTRAEYKNMSSRILTSDELSRKLLLAGWKKASDAMLRREFRHAEHGRLNDRTYAKRFLVFQPTSRGFCASPFGRTIPGAVHTFGEDLARLICYRTFGMPIRHVSKYSIAMCAINAFMPSIYRWITFGTCAKSAFSSILIVAIMFTLFAGMFPFMGYLIVAGADYTRRRNALRELSYAMQRGLPLCLEDNDNVMMEEAYENAAMNPAAMKPPPAYAKAFAEKDLEANTKPISPGTVVPLSESRHQLLRRTAAPEQKYAVGSPGPAEPQILGGSSTPVHMVNVNSGLRLATETIPPSVSVAQGVLSSPESSGSSGPNNPTAANGSIPSDLGHPTDVSNDVVALPGQAAHHATGSVLAESKSNLEQAATLEAIGGASSPNESDYSHVDLSKWNRLPLDWCTTTNMVLDLTNPANVDGWMRARVIVMRFGRHYNQRVQLYTVFFGGYFMFLLLYLVGVATVFRTTVESTVITLIAVGYNEILLTALLLSMVMPAIQANDQLLLQRELLFEAKMRANRKMLLATESRVFGHRSRATEDDVLQGDLDLLEHAVAMIDAATEYISHDTETRSERVMMVPASLTVVGTLLSLSVSALLIGLNRVFGDFTE